MELDLSLIEITGEDDDSLLRLDDPSNRIFPCSPVHAPHPDTAQQPSLYGKMRNVQFADNYGGRNIKENTDVSVDETKLNMDPLQMKRTKKAKGYNLRKSLAWNKAFFTEEGVLDPEELSLVTGTFNLSNGDSLSAIQVEKNKPGKSSSPYFHSPKEKLSMKSPALGRGFSPRCESSTRYCVSPAKGITPPHVHHPVLSAQDVNRSGEKHSGCPRPKPSSSYKRPASISTASATSKEPKLTKSLIPRADRCTLPPVPRSALPKASFSTQIPGVEAKRVASSAKSTATVGKGTVAQSRVVKGSLVNTRGAKGSSMNNSGAKVIEKAFSCPKPSTLKELAKQPGLNKYKIPPKGPAPKDPQVSQIVGVTDPVCQRDGVCNKQNNTSLKQRHFPDDAQRQVSQMQAGKPTGLRVPSPSLGFFGQPMQSASVGDSLPRNISHTSTYYSGARNLEFAQRPLQAPEMVSMVRNDYIEPGTREPLFTANSGDVKVNITTSTSSQGVRADILEELTQNLSREFDRNIKKPSDSKKCDESVEMEASHTFHNLQDVDINHYEPLKHDENQGKSGRSRRGVLHSLSIEDCSVLEAEMSTCGDIQQITYGCKRSMFCSKKPSEEGIESRKCDSIADKAHLQGCKESPDEQMELDASSPKPKFGEKQELTVAAREEYPKDGTSNEDYCLSAAAIKDSGDNCHPLIQDKQKSWDDRDEERAETSLHDSCETLPETYNKSLDRCAAYPPIPDESIALGIEVHACLTDGPNDCTVGALVRTRLGVSNLEALESQLNCPENFPLSLCNSEVPQKPEVTEEDNAASTSYLEDDKISFVEAEVCDDNKMPSPGTQTDYEHEVGDRHKNFFVYDIPLLMSNSDETADDAVRAQNDEIVLQQSSDQVTESHKAGSDLEVVIANSGSTFDHGRDCGLAAENGSPNVDSNKLGSSSSQLKDLKETSFICEAAVFTTRNYSDPVSSDDCSHSETSHLNCSGDQCDIPDAALDDALWKGSSPMSYGVDVIKPEMNVIKTASADNDATIKVAVDIQDDTSSNIGGNCEQNPSNTATISSKPNCVVIVKPPSDVVPFSDEWLAAIEAAGEDILTMKSGAVQHSPTEKPVPEPSPWSPVKRNKNQGLGPFDCTKHTSLPGAPAADD